MTRLAGKVALVTGGGTGIGRACALLFAREDHAPEGIRVNCICPGLVETDLLRALLRRAPDPQAFLRSRIEHIPLDRTGQPEDVAQLALFLASEESSWLTGAALPLDGGLTAS